MKSMFRFFTHYGQTSVEYLLLLFVIITIAYSVFAQVRLFFADPENSYFSDYLEQFEETFGAKGPRERRFKQFPMNR